MAPLSVSILSSLPTRVGIRTHAVPGVRPLAVSLHPFMPNIVLQRRKFWQITDNLPNSPKFSPFKNLYCMVFDYLNTIWYVEQYINMMNLQVSLLTIA